jgi:mannonate dehydratase
VTHLRRIADFAALYQVRTGCHGATDLSPVCMGAALHFDSWVPNFGIQEYMRHTPETDAVFPHAYHFAGGRLYPGDEIGHGVDIDEAEAAKHPYTPAYLPVARLEDGTMWSSCGGGMAMAGWANLSAGHGPQGSQSLRQARAIKSAAAAQAAR